MARPHSHPSLLLLLLLLLLPSAIAASYSSLCHSPASAADIPVPNHSLGESPPLALPWTYTGHFSGGGDLHFAQDNYYPHAFYFSPRSSIATTDPAVTPLTATLILKGTRRLAARRSYEQTHSVYFDLDGYYHSTGELCMVGSGSYAREDGFGVVLLSAVVLRLTVPHPANLSKPFVTGRLGGADFNSVTLVAYAENDYDYGEAASCPPAPPPHGARRMLPAKGFSCDRLQALLGRSSYKVEYMPDASGHAAAASGLFPLRRRHRSMYINQMRCNAVDNAVRAYMVFYDDQPAAASASNYTGRRWGRGHDEFLVGDEALVSDGFWDASRSRLCLRACRVTVASSDLSVSECGNIGVSFWFPAVWSARDRSVAAGMIWNASSNINGDAAGVISVSRTGGYRGNMTDIKYNYTLVEDARKHYDAMPALSKQRKGRFPGKTSYRDFEFGFSLKQQGELTGSGYAWPVTIGSAMVEGNELISDAAFGAAEEANNKQRLLNVSYSLRYRVTNSSASPGSPQLRLLSAEGVYDTKTGSLCMVACQQLTNGSSSDCEVLVTVQFAPMDAVARERTVGTIRSLKNKTDPMFFEALEFVGDGMYVEQVADSISRMDMESIMLMASMLLSCAFTALQLRHVTKHPEALHATSSTMLAVLAIGYAIPLVLHLEDAYMHDDNGRRQYIIRLASGGLLELNELVQWVTTVLALVLQLRLLHLAMSRRSTDDQAGTKHEHDDVERSTLWVCLPLYALGAVVVWIVHVTDAKPGPALVADLAAYAGLVLDGFLLPQVVRNALSGSSSRVRVAALSPWFYAGVGAIRAAPHAYDAFRKRGYAAPRWRASPSPYVYASPRDDIFGVGWDVAVPCGAALLAAVVFLQQRRGRAFLCGEKSSKRQGEYEMVSTVQA